MLLLNHWPGDDSVNLLEARIAAFGSPELRGLMEDWLELRADFIGSADAIRHNVGGREPWNDIEAQRQGL